MCGLGRRRRRRPDRVRVRVRARVRGRARFRVRVGDRMRDRVRVRVRDRLRDRAGVGGSRLWVEAEQRRAVLASLEVLAVRALARLVAQDARLR